MNHDEIFDYDLYQIHRNMVVEEKRRMLAMFFAKCRFEIGHHKKIRIYSHQIVHRVKSRYTHHVIINSQIMAKAKFI